MSAILRNWHHPRVLIGSVLALVAIAAAVTRGQADGAKAPARHFEYLQQEIQANAIAQSLNELDAAGWEVFQVIPSWQLKNDNAETLLTPRAYEVFGRRALAAK